VSEFPEDNPEESKLQRERFTSEWLKAMSPGFAVAARELEFEKVFEFVSQYSPSVLGKRALVKELQPSTDIDRIDRSFKEIAELRLSIVASEYPPLEGLSDILPILRKSEIEGSSLYVDEGARVLSVLKAMRRLREFFGRRVEKAPTLWKTAVLLSDDKLLEMHFESVFDSAGNVKDSASTELVSIRREIIQTASRLRERLTAILRRLSEDDYAQEEIITQRDGRFVLPIKVEHKRRVPGFIHSVSQTGQTVFIEPSETLDLNNELRSLEFAEQREIDRILRGLASRLREATPALISSLAATSHIEAVYAKSRYAEEISGSTPGLEQQTKSSKRKLFLKDARHPILLRKLGRAKVVPLTLELDENRRTLILTGPNAGGKTVLIKTVGVLTMMAQSGLPIPAEPDGILPLMDGVFVEIGDSQSIADDLSTFSSHVSSLRAILASVTAKSLVLLDELGGGTAPEEGGALAESILEHLGALGAFTIVTTHFGRLAAFAESSKAALNGSMEFDRDTLTPTFRFRPNIPGSSHAFEIAFKYGLKKPIIDRAMELRGTGSHRLEDLLRSLEGLQQEAQGRKVDADRELGKARIARVEYERKRDEVEDIRRTAKAKAATEAEELLKRANSFIEKAVREAREAARLEAKEEGGIKSGGASSSLTHLRGAQEADRKKLLEDLKRSESELTSRSKLAIAGQITVGAKVQLKTNPGQTGDVISIDGTNAEVLFGTLRMKAKLAQLELVAAAETGKSKKEHKRTVSTATQFLSESPNTVIDIRGQYGDEAIPVVEKFLSEANAHSLAHVEIIHGTGTGALGRRINEHLKGHYLVSSYRYGKAEEGGSGVTIVEMK
jgi:DNA mismatch repair protein MutS2